jgi:hypothetical protein
VGLTVRRSSSRAYVRKYAAEQGVSGDEALRVGMEEKSREFSEAGGRIYRVGSSVSRVFEYGVSSQFAVGTSRRTKDRIIR